VKLQTAFTSIYKMMVVIASVALLNACSSAPPPTVAETAAAARSVEVLNGGGSGKTADTVTARRVAFRPASVASVISPQDTLNVNIFKVPDLSASALKVEANGAISLPLVGSVKVSGLTISQAEKLITKRLTKYMHDPKVSVIRTDSVISKRVTVEGEVKTPGVFPIRGDFSFLQAIAMAQGLTEVGDSRTVLFYRDGAQHNVSLDLVRTGKISDPMLRGDDRIVVLKDPAKVKERKVLEYLPAVLSPISVFSAF